MSKIPTAIELTFQKFPKHNGIFVLRNIEEFMIEFAKIHIKEIQKLQKSKYYAGETGYIKDEEFIEILNNIK